MMLLSRPGISVQSHTKQSRYSLNSAIIGSRRLGSSFLLINVGRGLSPGQAFHSLPKLFYGTFEFMSKDFVKEIKRFKFLVVFKRFQKSGVLQSCLCHPLAMFSNWDSEVDRGSSPPPFSTFQPLIPIPIAHLPQGPNITLE